MKFVTVLNWEVYQFFLAKSKVHFLRPLRKVRRSRAGSAFFRMGGYVRDF